MGEVYVYRGGQLVLKRTAVSSDAPYAMPDISAFVTQDGVPISSRSHLRAYEQKNGVKQIGNDIDLSSIRNRIHGRDG